MGFFYVCIGYGEAWIYDLKDRLIIQLYNAGFSDNEEMDREFRDKYKTNIFFDRHPIIIAEFTKLPIFTKLINMNKLKSACYKNYVIKKSYRYDIEIGGY